ncbi:serine/threonine protein kinase [Aphanothece hegewaldii CCALA 016]|uniref:Serine/threonine-protein kinase B n=1 Tax=Aphanothece hegewaldii CCALA 016 TaxID=2107694 RepID=A0A2T1LQS6_9CHRO|nr:serine/threonine-protein kinase [Aphanothece hegewaldii]PSF29838.1 serine/threonine protein kinase [Aphanothece hegewaldii CCALA 016]
MSYCVNPSCPNPKNPDQAVTCQACGSSLLLRDRYQILGILGKGGFGATFATQDLSLPGKPLCVVKQLRPSTDDPNVFRMAKELFEREAETLGRVGNHPQVPRLLDYFEDQQQFYLVQEYIKGHNLHQEVKKRGPFSEAGVKQFLSELLPIINYIHEQKVIHRDIKPANLIRRQTDRKLVIIDFGAVKNQVNSIVASKTSAQTAFTAFAVGTQGFAPPEQMAMRPVYASDIYALGITCIYLLTARSPKDLEVDQNTGELLWENWVSVSSPFAKVLKTMLEVSVRHRYKSASEVLHALDMTAYSDSLQQSMITMPTPQDKRSDETFSSNLNSQISTAFSPNTRDKTSPPRGINSSPLYPINSPTPNGGMAYQMVQNNSKVKPNKERMTDITLMKKKGKLDARGIIEGYEKGIRDFAQEELNGLNLPKARLPGINFYQSKLTGANFQDADLSHADFGRTNLSQAILKNTNLSQAYLSYANLERADLRGADLTGAHLKYANLKGANLCGTNLCDAQVTPEQLALAKTNWLTVMPTGKRGFW